MQLLRLPHGLNSINNAFLEGIAAVAAAGDVEQASYKWAHACLVGKGWQRIAAAEQQSAAGQSAWDSYCTMVGATCDMSLQLHACVSIMMPELRLQFSAAWLRSF